MGCRCTRYWAFANCDYNADGHDLVNQFNLFDKLAYSHYSNGNWEGLLRTKFRIKFINKPLADEIIIILNKNKNLAKELFRLNRLEVLMKWHRLGISIPISFANLLFFINHFSHKQADCYNAALVLVFIE